jgi:hypothetical protein
MLTHVVLSLTCQGCRDDEASGGDDDRDDGSHEADDGDAGPHEGEDEDDDVADAFLEAHDDSGELDMEDEELEV